MSDLPILYSFRRCPYAIRARLAIASSGCRVELREIVLRDKAPEFLETSPSATVPCLKDGDDILDESFDIMLWALRRNDPEGWLGFKGGEEADALELIRLCDGPFKRHLDRYKYDSRYEGADRESERGAAAEYLWQLNGRLETGSWLMGRRATLADFAILPFVRQFANTDRDWFDGEGWTALRTWLSDFEASDRFVSVMPKWTKWQNGDDWVLFPASAA